MPDILAQALATPGLVWMLLAIGAAGLVRGFTGFGTAMIFVPIGTLFLPVADVVFMMSITGVFSTLALFPSAWREADKAEASTLAAAAAITVPIGLWMMARLDPVAVRWLASAVIGLTLAAVITGWRWQGKLTWPGRFTIGGASGVVGGMTGLTGPVVIVFYLANARDVRKVRANTIVFLGLLDVVIVVNLLVGGLAVERTFVVAAMLTVPYLCSTLIGKRLFDPRLETFYRRLAYSVIGTALVSGLPLFD